MRYLGLFNGVRSWLIIEKKRLIRYLAAIPGNRRRAWCLFIGLVNNWRQLSFWHVSVSNASLSRVGYLVLSVEKKEANLEVIRHHHHHHHHEICQYKISCKATQKYWFSIEINSLRILDIQCAIWNNIKKIETILISIR